MEFCDTCGRPAALAEIESAHHTSEGLVRYRRCACGHRWVQQAVLVAIRLSRGRRRAQPAG